MLVKTVFASGILLMGAFAFGPFLPANLAENRTPVIKKATNVLGTALESCCTEPMTGYYRDGFCNTDYNDRGSHTVCAIMTDEFLNFSKSNGNDLSTPRLEFGFSGLKSGDQWCLCAARFLEAYEAGFAPRVSLLATHKRALEIVPLDILREFALERN